MHLSACQRGTTTITMPAPPDSRLRSVSVVIAAYNQADVVREAVQSALQQTSPAFEVVVVDDGSTDGTAEAATAAGATSVIRRANGGAPAARNTGLEAARGQYVVFLDGDDRLHPTALQQQLAQLAEHPEASFVTGRNRPVDPDGRPLPSAVEARREGDLYEHLLRRAWVTPPSALLVDRSAAQQLGGFDAALGGGGDDLEFYLRLAQSFRGVDHTGVVTDYRLHSGGKSRSYVEGLASNLEALSRHPAPGAPHRLVAARHEGERYYQATYGRKVVLATWLTSLRERRGVGGASLAVLVLLRRDAPGVGRLLRETARRRMALAGRRSRPATALPAAPGQ